MRMYGEVLWFDPIKGYGFIKSEDIDNQTSYFAHYSEINSEDKHKTLKQGDHVSFTETTHDGKICAGDITVEDG